MRLVFNGFYPPVLGIGAECESWLLSAYSPPGSHGPRLPMTIQRAVRRACSCLRPLFFLFGMSLSQPKSASSHSKHLVDPREKNITIIRFRLILFKDVQT